MAAHEGLLAGSFLLLLLAVAWIVLLVMAVVAIIRMAGYQKSMVRHQERMTVLLAEISRGHVSPPTPAPPMPARPPLPGADFAPRTPQEAKAAWQEMHAYLDRLERMWPR